MPSYNVIGVQVDAISIDGVVRRMEEWIATRDRVHQLAMVNAHTSADAVRNPTWSKVINEADLRLPDGSPIWAIGRLKGFYIPQRVEGLELMDAFFRAAASKGYRSFFYGAGPGVGEKVGEYMTRNFPGAVFAGSYSPPYRDLTEQEDRAVVEMINNARPDVLWVSLGGSGPRGPKEHIWIYDHRPVLRVPVAAGVGQAFDTLSGNKPRLPMWVRRWGLEWLVRMFKERRTHFRRYLVYNTLFLFYLASDALGIGPSSRNPDLTTDRRKERT
jgi:N-acetylglucosaminyldiphosphoundecaprenol N-acetyl-beta-D-mannosaminyltransferase